jgi:hypothetical protein
VSPPSYGTDKYPVNDLPDETVKALARLTHHDSDDEVLAPPRKKACKESTKDISGTIDKLASMACDTKPQSPKTTGTYFLLNATAN